METTSTWDPMTWDRTLCDPELEQVAIDCRAALYRVVSPEHRHLVHELIEAEDAAVMAGMERLWDRHPLRRVVGRLTGL